GSAAMLESALSTDESATDLRAAVTSPGGTTAAAVRELERNGLRTGFFEALSAAKERSKQLGITSE
ncbi:MAG: pyrroline-5-carboxylate reductase dimerization domain-containing protein, partial [Mycobacteriaceae bacterium]